VDMSTTLGEIQERTFAVATQATRTSFPPARRLSDGQLTAYLQRRAYAVVATGRADGRPHVALSSYALRDTDVWLPTVSGSVREQNLRHQPWASLVVTEGDQDQHVVVLLEGPAAVVDAADVPADVRDALTADWVSAWIRLRVERLLSYAAEGVEL